MLSTTHLIKMQCYLIQWSKINYQLFSLISVFQVKLQI